MKIKLLIIASSFFISIFSLVLFVSVLFVDDTSQEAASSQISQVSGLNLSPEVLKHKTMVEKYAKENGISEYVIYLLAIIQVESGGTMKDVMQSSESKGLPPNSLDTEESIKQGCQYFASLIKAMKEQGCDLEAAIQAYNYGGGYLNFVVTNGKGHTFELATRFAKEKADGKKVTYTNPIAVSENGGWRYSYGNMFYQKLVAQYIGISGNSQKFDDKTVQVIFDEAVKYTGMPYVFGGSTPATSFDCSGLTQWCYAKAGLTIPRVAQAQYDVMAHLPLAEAKPGDLIFFHSTYNAGSYVTHVALYAGNNRIFHAGDPIGYADLNTTYWQQHLIGAGRLKK